MAIAEKKTSAKSLEEVHGSVNTALKKNTWGKLFAFFGPAYLVSVGWIPATGQRILQAAANSDTHYFGFC